MIERTFIQKSTTIVKDSEYNFGLCPTASLNYGHIVSRALIYFPIDELKKKFEDRTFADISKVKHILKLFNCGNVDVGSINKKIFSSDLVGYKDRATSFDVILFLIPKEWDEGRGFDYGADFLSKDFTASSKQGCNWYQSQNGNEWEYEGIYSNTVLSLEYDKFSVGEESIVIGRQHFDFGNENFEIDITDTVNKFISGELKNYGIGLAFSPLLEGSNPELTQYVGFFTNNTNSFYEPYLETIYSDYINDDRAQFYIGKQNRLYLYCHIGSDLDNLDYLPTCTIDGVEFEVKQTTKGVYFVEIMLKNGEVEPNTIYYDKWSNLTYKGEILDDVEMEFVALPSNKFFNIGEKSKSPQVNIPAISGINDGEKLIQGEKRIIEVHFREKYSSNKYELVDNAEYRLYVKDSDREVDVIKFHPIEKMHLYNFFTINTNQLVPQIYYVDVKVKNGGEVRLYKECLRFEVVSNVTNIRR